VARASEKKRKKLERNGFNLFHFHFHFFQQNLVVVVVVVLVID